MPMPPYAAGMSTLARPTAHAAWKTSHGKASRLVQGRGDRSDLALGERVREGDELAFDLGIGRRDPHVTPPRSAASATARIVSRSVVWTSRVVTPASR